MSIYETVKKLKLEARKQKDTVSVGFLTFLQGEIERNDDRSDPKVIKVINGIITKLTETEGSTPEVRYYQTLLEQHAPKPLTEDETREYVKLMGIRAEGTPKLGEIQKGFKENFAGRYDGALVSKLFKEIYG